MVGSLINLTAVQGSSLSDTNLVGRVIADAQRRAAVEKLLQEQKAVAHEVIVANRAKVEALRDALLQRYELVGQEIVDRDVRGRLADRSTPRPPGRRESVCQASVLLMDDTERFRGFMARCASGVVVVTTRVDDEDHAMTANSFTSVSLEPPLVLFCVQLDSRFHTAVSRTDRWVVNMLSADQAAAARWFAERGRPLASQMEVVEYHRDAEKTALLTGSIGYLTLHHRSRLPRRGPQHRRGPGAQHRARHGSKPRPWCTSTTAWARPDLLDGGVARLRGWRVTRFNGGAIALG